MRTFPYLCFRDNTLTHSEEQTVSIPCGKCGTDAFRLKCVCTAQVDSQGGCVSCHQRRDLPTH